MKQYLIIYLVGLLALSSCNTKQDIRFKLSPEEAAQEANSGSYVISPELLGDIYYSMDKSSNYQFIDLRTPLLYDNGHLKGAINIPFTALSHNHNCETFISQKHINIIYGESTEQVIFAGFLLQQLGIQNYFIILGDYDFIENNIIKHYNVLSAPYNPEIAQYNYAKIVKETAGSQNYSGGGKTAKPTLHIKRRKKAAAGGGCD